MEMPGLLPEHQALAILAGNWLGQENIHPSPFDQAGGPAIGRVHNRMALDGFAVIQDYEQERRGIVNFRGHGIFRWDAGEKCYMLHWFDSFGLPPVDYRGALQGQMLTLTAPQPQGFARATFDFPQDGQYQYRMEVSPDGNQWFVFVDGEYRRQSNP
jgi:hypothetical protein